jgi:TolB protein
MYMTIQRSVSILSIMILCTFSSLAHAKLLNIIIDGGQISGIPVAVVPFNSEGADKGSILNISEVIHSDLKSSGQFNPLPAEHVRQFPSQPTEVQYPYWQSMKIENMVIGKMRKSGNGYIINFSLLDVIKQRVGSTQAPLLSMQFDNVQPQNLRALAHHISDLIFQKLIGTRGFFSTRIAYISKHEGVGGVHTLEVADYDGFNPKALYRSNFPIMSPTWSPDGKKIAFVSFEKERASINIVEVASGRTERVTQYPGINSAPTWSPDGRTLALVLSKDGGPKIYTLDMISKSLNRVTEGTGIDTEPCFSPDGRSIVFTSDRGGKPQIYRVTLGSGKTERLTFAGNYNAKPSLTPDGKSLVTLHRGEEGLFSIALHSLANGGVRILTQTGLNDSPALAPNGMMVIYGAEEKGRRVLSAVTLDGRLKIRLPGQEGEVQEPAWSPFVSS